MGLIVNPRGIAGSGKTELVRRILGAFGQSPEVLAKSGSGEQWNGKAM